MRNIQVSLVGRQPGGALQGLRVPPPIDHLILLHSDDPESLKAAQKVRAVAIEMIAPNEVELIPIDPFGMNEVLTQVTSIPRRLPGCHITVNISGGTNIMAGAALVGCFMLGADAVYIKDDRTNPSRPIEEKLLRLPVPKVVLENLSRTQTDILRLLSGTHRGILSTANTAISAELGISPQLASYHLRRLVGWRLVEASAVGRRKDISLTDTGRLFAFMLRRAA